MKKNPNFLFLSLSLIFICCLFPACKDDTKDTPDAVGTFTWAEWQAKSGWSDHSASNFTPDSAIVDKMKSFFKPGFVLYSFALYGSNWCHKDCEPQMPKIIKFLKASGMAENKITIYGLNRARTEPADAMAKWAEAFPSEDCYVPTLVIYIYSDDMSNKICKVKCETTDFPEWQNKILEAME